MKNNIHIILFFLALAFAGCNGNFFDTEIELPTPEHDPVLAISCFINSTDTGYVEARVSRTYGLFEDQPDSDRIDDATLELYEDGDLLFTFDNLTLLDLNYSKFQEEPFGGIGKTYELRATHSEFGTASATQVMPVPVPLTDIEFNTVQTSEIFSTADGEFKITFKDPAGEANYYELIATKQCSYTFYDYYTGEEITETYNELIYFETEFTNDPNLQRGFNYEALLISDQNFDGNTFTFRPRFYTCYDEDGGSEEAFTLYWRTVTEDYFRYSISLRNSLDAEDNPFAEPVSLYTNFEGGVGAFCMRSELIYEVE